MTTDMTKTKKWMLTGVCCAMIVSCAGIQTVFAQDHEAVGRRLRAAVAAGELTGEQAIERMAAYKKRVGQGKGSADTEEKLDDAIAKRLKAAVKAGKISEEDARARLNRMRKMLDTREPRTREGDPKAVQKGR